MRVESVLEGVFSIARSRKSPSRFAPPLPVLEPVKTLKNNNRKLSSLVLST